MSYDKLPTDLEFKNALERVDLFRQGKGPEREIVFQGERPHASTKPFGFRTFTQIGPVGRSIMLAVHDRVHGIDRAAEYKLVNGRLLYMEDLKFEVKISEPLWSEPNTNGPHEDIREYFESQRDTP